MSKTIFFLVPYPIGEAPSQRFRFEQYFEHLESMGYSIEVYPFLDRKTWQSLYEKGATWKKTKGILRAFIKRFLLLFSVKKADHIFIHREAAHIGPPIFEWILAKILRRKFIYDFDDAIWLPNYSEQNAKFHRLKAYWKVEYLMKWAFIVSAGNNYLASYAGQFNKNVRIIPTTIDTENHHNLLTNHSEEPPVIGWTGTHTTMRYLDAIVPVLKRLEKEYSFRFIVISNEQPVYDLACLSYIPWRKETEIEDLAKIHIGVMPLEHDIWSEGKCGFKGLQYMSLGIASIMSPVGVNTTIVQQGQNGYLASTEEEWYDALKKLLINKELRQSIGNNGKKTVMEYYSVKSMKDRYQQLFENDTLFR